MKKNANKKGFTLVELIVVVCIFGIILGAILRIIKPTNEIYSDADHTMHTNIIGSGIAEYLDDELRYATKIQIFQGYIGVPEVSMTGKVGDLDAIFTDCIIIDNHNPRGANLNSYDPSADTLVNKFGSTGSVIKVPNLNKEGLNLQNSIVCKGVDFYERYKFDINLDVDIWDTHTHMTGSGVDAHDVINLTMKSYVPEMEDGAYVFNKTKYKKTTSIELLNVNISDDDDRTAASVDFYVNDFMYGMFPQETGLIPAGATDAQKAFYDTSDSDNTYTYIFYQRPDSNLDNKCEVRLFYDPSDPDFGGQQIEAGRWEGEKAIKKGTTFNSFTNSFPSRTGYGEPHWVNADDPSTPIDTTKGVQINKNTDFYVVFPKDPDMEFVPIYFKNIDGSTTSSTVAIVKYPGGGYSSAKASTANSIPSGPADLPANMKCTGWVQSGTGLAPADVDCTYGGTYVFEPILEERFLARFYDGDGNELTDSENAPIYVDNGATANYLGEDPAAPTDMQFDKWVLESDDTKEMFSTPITDAVAEDSTDFPGIKEVKFVPLFKEKESGGDSTITNLTADGYQTMWFTINYTNNTSDTMDTVSFTVPLPSGLNEINQYVISGSGTYTSYNGASVSGNYVEVTRSGDKLTVSTVDHPTWGNAGMDIEPGQTIIIKVELKNWGGFDSSFDGSPLDISLVTYTPK